MTRRALPPIPLLVPGASQGATPERASAEQQAALGFPGQLRDDWKAAAVARMGEQLVASRSLRMAMDSCMRCGACTDKCHFFLGDGSPGSGDPKNMPVARQDLYRKVYRRHFTFAGRVLPKLVGAEDFSEALLQDWYRYFHQCTQCRRCTEFCPAGIDTAEISMAARDIMNHVGVGQRYSNEVVAKAERSGNNLGLPRAVIVQTLEALAEEVEEDTGVSVRFPLDEAGAEILLVLPSADLFAEPHVEGLIGCAKVLHQAGLSWTLSSQASEAANFGLFIGADEQRESMSLRIVEAARSLQVKRIVYGECGHAWRIAYNEMPALAAALPDLDRRFPVPQHIVEVSYALLREGRLRLDPARNDALRVTYHDSCNVARAAGMGGVAGGQFELPRALLRAACNHFYDMAPETIRERTFCCGAGGGLLGDDIMEVRRRGAGPRLRALDAVVQAHGVTHMVAICAICKTQFSRVLNRSGSDADAASSARAIGPEAVLSLHQVVGNALVF